MATAKKTAAKKTTTNKAAAKKKPAKKVPTKKTAAKKTPSKKTTTKKTTAKKSPAKKISSKRSAARKSSSKTAGPKYSPAASEDVREEMHEMKRGKLRMGRSAKKVTNPKQAIAIGLSKARREGKKVPPKPNTGR